MDPARSDRAHQRDAGDGVPACLAVPAIADAMPAWLAGSARMATLVIGVFSNPAGPGLATSEIVPAMAALTEEGRRGGLRLTRHTTA